MIAEELQFHSQAGEIQLMFASDESSQTVLLSKDYFQKIFLYYMLLETLGQKGQKIGHLPFFKPNINLLSPPRNIFLPEYQTKRSTCNKLFLMFLSC